MCVRVDCLLTVCNGQADCLAAASFLPGGSTALV